MKLFSLENTMQDSVTVERISKKYDIGKLQMDTNFREVLVRFAKGLFLRNHENKVEIWALKDVSFSMKQGEIVGLIGRNGAGKSTLLKILSRITYPTSGKMNIRGRVGSLLEVGTGFHEELTGRENVYLNGSILGMTKREVKSKLDEIVSFAEVEKFMETPIKHYSSGMRLRLGFSVAAHLDTDVLFVDEVLAVGDAAFQAKCIEKMKELRDSGRTLIVVSHTMETVQNLCPRALWIDNGNLRQDGRTEDVIKSYMGVIRGKWGSDIKITEIFGGKQESGYGLTHALNRKGSGEIQYTGIEFRTPEGQQKEHIFCGDSLKMRLHYQVHKQVSKPKFFVRIRNQFGEKVTTVGTHLSGLEIPILYPGIGYIDLDLEYLNIMPDRYYITLWIDRYSDIPGEKEILYDYIERCAPLNVEYVDYYRSGRGVDKIWGSMFMACKWNFDGMNSEEIVV
jgi:lipopolysaccharide transport system ATP-binding protein